MEELRERVERFIREHELIPSGGEVTCLVSGGADSTCLWHVLDSLGYRVSALHVNHKLRGTDSDEDARFCADLLGAEVVELDGSGLPEAALREQRRSVGSDRLRATGHTASDQVETILYRLVSRGAATGMTPRSDDGVVHQSFGSGRLLQGSVKVCCACRGPPWPRWRPRQETLPSFDFGLCGGLRRTTAILRASRRVRSSRRDGRRLHAGTALIRS